MWNVYRKTDGIAVQGRYFWLWDSDMDNAAFEAVLRGEVAQAPHDQCWAIAQLLEYAACSEIRRLLPHEGGQRRWPELWPRLRSKAHRERMAFVCGWLRERRNKQVWGLDHSRAWVGNEAVASSRRPCRSNTRARFLDKCLRTWALESSNLNL